MCVLIRTQGHVGGLVSDLCGLVSDSVVCHALVLPDVRYLSSLHTSFVSSRKTSLLLALLLAVALLLALLAAHVLRLLTQQVELY
jgi:hypothetical protein